MDLTPLDRLIANDEIRNLVARYAIATDARDLDTLVGLFVDDVNVGRLGTGRDALRASFDQALFRLYSDEFVTLDEALARSEHPEDFRIAVQKASLATVR